MKYNYSRQAFHQRLLKANLYMRKMPLREKKYVRANGLHLLKRIYYEGSKESSEV